MNISVNGEAHTVGEARTLGAALKAIGVTIERGVAVAVNDRVVSRDKLELFEIHPNDRVLLITATQGG
jgi:sulfur carrier protein